LLSKVLIDLQSEPVIGIIMLLMAYFSEDEETIFRGFEVCSLLNSLLCYQKSTTLLSTVTLHCTTRHVAILPTLLGS
jgi:hypothetical protein